MTERSAVVLRELGPDDEAQRRANQVFADGLDAHAGKCGTKRGLWIGAKRSHDLQVGSNAIFQESDPDSKSAHALNMDQAGNSKCPAALRSCDKSRQGCRPDSRAPRDFPST